MTQRQSHPFARAVLTLAGGACLLLAVFQAVISCVPSWSAYFDAPQYYVARPLLLLLLGFFAALLLAVAGLYGLSGAGRLRRLPLLRPVLLGAGAVLTLRGAALAPQALALAGVISLSPPVGVKELVFSVFPLVLGLLYLSGTCMRWRMMAQPRASRTGREPHGR